VNVAALQENKTAGMLHSILTSFMFTKSHINSTSGISTCTGTEQKVTAEI
jgi:hypothetical protein